MSWNFRVRVGRASTAVPNAFKGASESRDGDSLRVSINNKLRDVIFEDIDDNSIASLLYDVIYGSLTILLASGYPFL